MYKLQIVKRQLFITNWVHQFTVTSLSSNLSTRLQHCTTLIDITKNVKLTNLKRTRTDKHTHDTNARLMHTTLTYANDLSGGCHIHKYMLVHMNCNN